MTKLPKPNDAGEAQLLFYGGNGNSYSSQRGGGKHTILGIGAFSIVWSFVLSRNDAVDGRVEQAPRLFRRAERETLNLSLVPMSSPAEQDQIEVHH